jgi:choline kinase
MTDDTCARSAQPVAAVILAAGLGSRLGRPGPKPLTPLRDGRSIIVQQIEHIRAEMPSVGPILIVVGHAKELVMEHVAEHADRTCFVYNPRYRATNTAKSLLAALRVAPQGGVLWLNGDVVFSPGLLGHVATRVDSSFVAVNTESVGDEEVKYTLNDAGAIDQLSKEVVGGLGEAVGINFLAADDRVAVLEALAEVADQDYFERALELAIARGAVAVKPVDVSRFGVVEVDFADDLARANKI